jgi:pyruvate-formate lyase-activating enzyme
VEIIKPSHYDDDGYVIQWLRAFVPSNSLACLYGLVSDVKQRRGLGADVDIVINAYDEVHTVIPTKRIIRRIQANGGRGIVFLAGVQSNQFPRAADLAREFRAAGIQVAIGGFHVSGCLAMLPELPADIQAVQDLGVTLFAGEAEGRMESFLRDACQGALQPVYNYMLDLPELQGQVTPLLPRKVSRRYMYFSPFDVGRGCPFQCSFCTIINVQGRKSRYRDADDVEQLVRGYAAQGIKRFFITDDNLARNKNWEAIFDRLIELREKEGIRLKFVIQVDTMCHKIPNFIEKVTRAGCNRVFIGLENINPENLKAAKKFQNRITEYRAMLQAWRAQGVITYAGYILGMPADTPESIARDIQVIQRELPIDIVEFMILTPLPGSADHREMHFRGEWMDPDMNKYDLEHVTARHPKMTADQWQAIYERAWHLYYTPEHIETLIRRAVVSGGGAHKTAMAILAYYGSYRFENVHPLQCGIFRRKVRTTRRPGLPRENPLVFHARRVWQSLATYARVGAFFLQLDRLSKRLARAPDAQQYCDLALTPVATTDHDELELYQLSDAARAVAARLRTRTRQPIVAASDTDTEPRAA